MPASPATFIVGPDHIGLRLDRVLADHLAAPGATGLTRAAVQRLIVRGAVSVNGRIQRQPSTPVQLGFRLVCDLGVGSAPASGSAGRGRDGRGRDGRAMGADPVVAVLPLLEAVILFEDDWLLVADKPAGLPTHATVDPRRPHLHGELIALLGRRSSSEPAGQEPYLGIHHRLDRDTSGVVVFTKRRDANKAVGDAFAGHQVTKQYLAICTGRGPGANRWTVRDRLARVSPTSEAARYAAVAHGGQLAETDLAIRERRPAGRVLVAATPRTGRTHQIRVHLAGCGLPIVGDTLYGGASAPRALLHAWRLALPHPDTGALLELESPWPDDFRAG